MLSSAGSRPYPTFKGHPKRITGKCECVQVSTLIGCKVKVHLFIYNKVI